MAHTDRFTVQRGWKLLLSDLGLSASEVLAHAVLPGDLLVRSDATVSAAEYARLWEALEFVAGTDLLALRVGQAISMEMFDPSIFAALCSPNLNVALRRVAQYKRLISPLTMTIDENDRQTSVTLTLDGGFPLTRQVSVLEIVFLVEIARLATRQRIVPAQLELPSLHASRAEYEAYFGVSLSLSERTCVTFTAHDAQRPFVMHDNQMWSVFETHLNTRLSDLQQSHSFTQRVRSALLELLPSGRVSMDEVTRQLGVTRRTLQRHLGAEGRTFQQVLNGTRQDLADHYLTRTVLPAGEIAFLLGFQDQTSFQRAYRDWTGVTPGSVRAI